MNRRGFLRRLAIAGASLSVSTKLLTDRATATTPTVKLEGKLGEVYGRQRFTLASDIIMPAVFMPYVVEHGRELSPFWADLENG